MPAALEEQTIPYKSSLDTAKERIHRAFSVKFDREPNSHEEEQITAGSLRVAEGASFHWQAKGNQPLLRFGLPGEESEEELQAADLLELDTENSRPEEPSKAPSSQREHSLKFKQLQYCRFRACGDSQASAYIKAGYNASNAKSAAVCASQLEKRPGVSAYLQSLRKSTYLANALSIEEKRDFLATVVRTPVGEIDEKSPLCQSYKVDKEGQIEYKMPDKLRALELDAKLAGELKESTAQSSLTLNLIQQRMDIPTAVSGEYIQAEVQEIPQDTQEPE